MDAVEAGITESLGLPSRMEDLGRDAMQGFRDGSRKEGNTEEAEEGCYGFFDVDPHEGR